MALDNNVIDISSRRKGKSSKKVIGQRSAAVVDMTERRQEMLKEERRTARRTILTEFVGAFIVVPQRGLCEVALYDISDSGMSFDLEAERGQLKDGEEIAMRIYMNQHTYFPFTLKVSNIRQILDEGVTRHGGEFVKGMVNETALHHFVKFIESVSSSLKRDTGDIQVSNLNR